MTDEAKRPGLREHLIAAVVTVLIGLAAYWVFTETRGFLRRNPVADHDAIKPVFGFLREFRVVFDVLVVFAVLSIAHAIWTCIAKALGRG